ncbi:LytR C-terminal domain-containing protein [Streptacidiphilus sp. EB129]|uniref:LCP family protein n=1 Tax=Streptacidiphilus sp. EB129 TaxID=3156262 RepID=UPI003517FFE1
MTGTADRRGPGGEAWPEEPQQGDYAAPYGGVPSQYGYEQQYQQGYDTGQYPAPLYDEYGRPVQQYQEPGYGYQQPAAPGYQDYPEYPQHSQPPGTQQYRTGQQQYQETQQYQGAQEYPPAQQYPGYQEQQYQPTAYQPSGYQASGYATAPSYDAPVHEAPAHQAPAQQAPARETSAPAAEPRAYVPPQPAPKRTAPGAAALPSEKVGYNQDEFGFVDDEEESADVIDWLKFSETRGERRDERRRQLRSRGLAVLVALAVVAVAGAGYLWATGKLFASSPGTVAASTQRTVIAVHLHDLNKNVTTALLVSDPGAGKASVVLLPGTLGVPTDGGGPSVALSSSVDAQGNAATRTGLNTLLGSQVSATWALYTPFLQLLVDHLNGITLNADTTISQNGKDLVTAGQGTLNGTAAIAYATYQAKGESTGAQLSRFGQVLSALVQAMPQDPTSAAADITSMGAVPDPSLPDATLGALLATMSKDAHSGHADTRTLPVKADGGLPATASTMVKQLLGGSVSANGGGPTVARVAVQDASGSSNKVNLADAAVINGGFTLVPGTAKAASTQATTTISYTDDARAADARTLASALGLPASVVRKVTTSQDADLLVVLGQDYKG